MRIEVRPFHDGNVLVPAELNATCVPRVVHILRGPQLDGVGVQTEVWIGDVHGFAPTQGEFVALLIEPIRRQDGAIEFWTDEVNVTIDHIGNLGTGEFVFAYTLRPQIDLAFVTQTFA